MLRKKFTALVISLMLVIVSISGCLSQVKSTKITDKDAVDIMEESEEKAVDNQANEEKDTDEENKEAEESYISLVFKLGEVAEVENRYNIKMIGLNETDDRNQFSNKEVAQVLIIDFVYENLGLDESLKLSDMDFKFVDEGGNMCDTYPVKGAFEGKAAPVGTRSFASMTIGTIESSSKIRVLYYENMFDNEHACEFELTLNENVEVDFSDHQRPSYSNAYKIGDIIEVDTKKGKYTLTIDSIEKTNDRNQFEESKPAEVYLINYTYSNIDYEEPLRIHKMNFDAIDSHGNMMTTYPASINKHPQEAVKGTKSSGQMAFGSLTTGDNITLVYSDNMFQATPDFFINLDIASE
ncbi:hypothetical protein [Vallitalea guaymasensis]|uniref:hypothetical protein n=1 Tax=Vallitalea guaymasensis TaxID=1185412 RepID=UPI0023538C08|nr:hypothetical protein [Vallitalea guaymasensis]